MRTGSFTCSSELLRHYHIRSVKNKAMQNEHRYSRGDSKPLVCERVAGGKHLVKEVCCGRMPGERDVLGSVLDELIDLPLEIRAPPAR